jgi:transcriptional regulator with GAF, ATPase, and Fis domain
VNGRFQRVPLGARKVGVIGATGQALLVDLTKGPSDWIADPAWAKRERLQAFAGQPLVFRGEVIGVLGVFSRERLGQEELGWLRTFADHAAIAIAHARSMAEIERLKEQLELENAYLREDLRTTAPAGIVGDSPAVQKVLQQVSLVAPTVATVLIQGESGTGKELVARAIHDNSGRRQRPLITVNCAAIPRELFESEFFGHAKGSFTGALRDRAGRFQAADGGTLFLDEVGEIPIELQAKLLRVLQEGRFERVGEETTRTVDVRILAATNRDLQGDVAAQRFRRDLYYRLSVFPIVVPPLRDRLEDVGPLAAYFIEHAARRFGRPAPRLTTQAVKTLEAYHWPGNIRELQHVIERAVLLSSGRLLRLDGVLSEADVRRPSDSPPAPRDPTPAIIAEAEWKQRERQNLRAALRAADGRIYGDGGAAELLGVNPTTLISRLNALGLRDVRRRPRRVPARRG